MKNLKNFKEKNDLNNITLKKMDEINVLIRDINICSMNN
jgi:hypothetical protein